MAMSYMTITLKIFYRRISGNLFLIGKPFLDRLVIKFEICELFNVKWFQPRKKTKLILIASNLCENIILSRRIHRPTKTFMMVLREMMQES